MLAAFSITPLGAGDSVSGAVADAVRLVRESGLPNETNAMFTNVEGEWDEVMSLIKACMMKVGETAPRVSLVIKVDHRPGVTGALRHKIESVERRLAAPQAGISPGILPAAAPRRGTARTQSGSEGIAARYSRRQRAGWTACLFAAGAARRQAAGFLAA